MSLLVVICKGNPLSLRVDSLEFLDIFSQYCFAKISKIPLFLGANYPKLLSTLSHPLNHLTNLDATEQAGYPK
jgi:hypothetical protein